LSNELQPQTNESEAETLPDVQTLKLHTIPDGATRFQRYCLSFIELILGALMAWITVVNTLEINGQLMDHQAGGTQMPAGWITSVVAVIVGFSVLSIAGIFIGIWNLRGLGTMSPGPLVAAIVYSLTSVAMMTLFLSEYGATPSLVLLHAFIFFMTVRTLRQEGVKSLKDIRGRIG
jgi:hypothetical protein